MTEEQLRMARVALRSFREQLKAAKADLLVARVAGDASMIAAEAALVAVWQEKVFDLERELGIAEHHKDETQPAPRGFRQ